MAIINDDREIRFWSLAHLAEGSPLGVLETIEGDSLRWRTLTAPIETDAVGVLVVCGACACEARYQHLVRAIGPLDALEIEPVAGQTVRCAR